MIGLAITEDASLRSFAGILSSPVALDDVQYTIRPDDVQYTIRPVWLSSYAPAKHMRNVGLTFLVDF